MLTFLPPDVPALLLAVKPPREPRQGPMVKRAQQELGRLHGPSSQATYIRADSALAFHRILINDIEREAETLSKSSALDYAEAAWLIYNTLSGRDDLDEILRRSSWRAEFKSTLRVLASLVEDRPEIGPDMLVRAGVLPLRRARVEVPNDRGGTYDITTRPNLLVLRREPGSLVILMDPYDIPVLSDLGRADSLTMMIDVHPQQGEAEYARWLIRQDEMTRLHEVLAGRSGLTQHPSYTYTARAVAQRTLDPTRWHELGAGAKVPEGEPPYGWGERMAWEMQALRTVAPRDLPDRDLRAIPLDAAQNLLGDLVPRDFTRAKDFAQRLWQSPVTGEHIHESRGLSRGLKERLNFIAGEISDAAPQRARAYAQTFRAAPPTYRIDADQIAENVLDLLKKERKRLGTAPGRAVLAAMSVGSALRSVAESVITNVQARVQQEQEQTEHRNRQELIKLDRWDNELAFYHKVMDAYAGDTYFPDNAEVKSAYQTARQALAAARRRLSAEAAPPAPTADELVRDYFERTDLRDKALAVRDELALALTPSAPGAAFDEKRSKFILVDEALAEYGAGLISDEYIVTPAGKATSVRAKIQGKKLIFESDKGQKLATGPINAATVRSFVEAFWFWKPK